MTDNPPGYWHDRYRNQVEAQGNDRFMHSASPGVTSEIPSGEGSVWWPLRLNDMDPEAAMVVALLHHQMLSAYGDASTSRYQLRELNNYWPKREIIKDDRLAYEPWLPEEVAEARAEHELRATISMARYDYLKELLEAAYVG